MTIPNNYLQIVCLLLIVVGNWKENSSVVKRFDILLRLFGSENVSGPLRNGPLTKLDVYPPKFYFRRLLIENLRVSVGKEGGGEREEEIEER